MLMVAGRSFLAGAASTDVLRVVVVNGKQGRRPLDPTRTKRTNPRSAPSKAVLRADPTLQDERPRTIADVCDCLLVLLSCINNSTCKRNWETV